MRRFAGANLSGARRLCGVLISSMGVSSAMQRPGTSRGSASQRSLDEQRMGALAAFTARSLATEWPVPFGSSIIHTRSGELLIWALNAVAREFDPSSHAEVRAIRLATKKLKSISLAGYTLYTTCEPCPMCMSTALWAGLDRVVYGATIEDANRHCRQIHIHATEIAERSDMRCKVEGPVLREQCYALFTHPNMLRAFRSWSTRKSGSQRRKTADD
jgi:tRNA(Arg) A34 adenosine deaminase TadA